MLGARVKSNKAHGPCLQGAFSPQDGRQVWRMIRSARLGSMRKDTDINAGGQEVAGKVLRWRMTGLKAKEKSSGLTPQGSMLNYMKLH